MSTASADERLSAYLDGELTVDESRALESDLQRDASLRAELDALRRVVSTLGDEGPVRAPLGFHAAVMDRIEQEHPRESWWASFLRRPFGVPAQGWGVMLAAAAVLVVVQVGRQGEQAEPLATDDAPVWRDVDPSAPAAAKLEGLDAAREAEGTPPATRAERAAEEAERAQAADPDREEKRKLESMAAKAEAEAEAAAAAKPEAAPDLPDTGKQPVLRAPPSGFTLLTNDAGVLRQVLSLVGRLGGSVTTLDGQDVTTAALESSEQSVMIRVPSDQLPAFQQGLQKMGNVQAKFDPDRLVRGDTIEVPLTFKLTGGAGAGSAEPLAPAAARKAKESMEIDERR